MLLAKIVIREVERNRSLKVFKLFAECVGETGQTAAMHPKRMLLLFNVAGRDAINVGHPANNGLFRFDHFRRAVPIRLPGSGCRSWRGFGECGDNRSEQPEGVGTPDRTALKALLGTTKTCRSS